MSTAKLIAATLVLLVGGKPASARADETIGVAVVGAPSLEAPIAAMIGNWLTHHGHHVAADALPATAVGTVGDCFVIQDDGCARTAFAQHATSDALVYVGVELSTEPTGRAVTLHAHWVAKDQPTITQSTTCTRCSDAELQAHVDNLMVAVVVATGGVVSATTPTTSSAALATTTTAASPPGPRGIAFGVELGEPTSATAGWFAGRLGVTGALGTGTFGGIGPALHAEGRYEVTRLGARYPLRVGVGGRFYHHGYDPASIDEIPDSHYGVRAVVEISMTRGPLQLYAELAPGVDLKRTRSCTLAQGVDSICPHAQRTPLFINLAIGARWFAIH